MGRPVVTEESFWDRVSKGLDGECWKWTGPVSHSKRGGMAYGRIDAFGEKGVYVHRVAYWLTHPGVIPLRKDGDLLVRHKCDNPLCCNPMHLELGTHQDNMTDMVERGRKRYRGSTETPRAKLSIEAVRSIRALHAGKRPYADLMAQFGVSKATITGVISKRHYADVD